MQYKYQYEGKLHINYPNERLQKIGVDSYYDGVLNFTFKHEVGDLNGQEVIFIARGLFNWNYQPKWCAVTGVTFTVSAIEV